MIFFPFFKGSKTSSAVHTTPYSMAKRARGENYQLKIVVRPQNRDSLFGIVIRLSRFTRQNFSLSYTTNAYRESTTNLNLDIKLLPIPLTARSKA